jgi:hypothetical protein
MRIKQANFLESLPPESSCDQQNDSHLSFVNPVEKHTRDVGYITEIIYMCV